MAVLFTSDLHLDAEHPETVERFLSFIHEDAVRSEGLYILGDLFEAWVGDDDTDPAMQPVVQAIAALHKAGVPCAIMHGNRDFLLGRRFASATGCRLLGDYETVEVSGERVLLTHGDLLCTDDAPYQALRSMVREPAWQRAFLAKPLAERKALADAMRQRSRTETAAKAEDIMDVNQGTVEDVMSRFGVLRLLHGHTHRPAVHEFALGGAPASRIVLGAWHDRGHVVRWDEDGFRLETI